MSTQPDQLKTANEAKVRRARTAALKAVEDLESEGLAVSVHAVAKRAGVSRNFIYSHVDLLNHIRSRPTLHPRLKAVPAKSRSTEVSLRSRLVTAHEHIEQLKVDLADERASNARLLGEIRKLRR